MTVFLNDQFDFNYDVGSKYIIYDKWLLEINDICISFQLLENLSDKLYSLPAHYILFQEKEGFYC